ncbi:hypothetical protein [Salinisphaera sp. Q1T1-3]|uniref:hypothetical protein n=1 Tax=Salinisphaera sp. Q1T1-3 TaxID=2321229 RepID=UPI0011C3FED1|nr:hypothetical protein [Salinisphaera sp. Q1T1-3]
MTQGSDTRPEGETIDPNALPPHAYHRTVGPALQVAADVAARRGHKHLFDDMPAMLGLVDLVTRLADLYIAYYPDTPADHRLLLDNAATAACVMVFQEARLDADTIDHLLRALEAAYAQAQTQAVLEGSERYVAMAFSHLDEMDRDPGRHCLKQACEHVVAAIEVWRGETQ